MRHVQPSGYTVGLITNIVLRCGCGKLKYQRIPGDHTLEQLRGEETEITRVLESLKK
jgi:hypothetical protein